MHVELNAPDRQLDEALALLADGPAHIRKALNAEIKDATADLQGAMVDSVMGIESRARRGGGGAARSLHGTTPGGRLPTHTGLRAVTANAIERKITYRGATTGVRMRVNLTKLPENQRTMPQAMNDGKVRHPLMGNRRVWIDQTFSPKGWFDRPTRIHGPAAVSRIESAANRAVRELQ